MTDSKADMSAEGLVADANRHLEFNRPEDALKSFDAAIAIKADNPEAYYGRGNALRTIGRQHHRL